MSVGIVRVPVVGHEPRRYRWPDVEPVTRSKNDADPAVLVELVLGLAQAVALARVDVQLDVAAGVRERGSEPLALLDRHDRVGVAVQQQHGHAGEPLGVFDRRARPDVAVEARGQRRRRGRSVECRSKRWLRSARSSEVGHRVATAATPATRSGAAAATPSAVNPPALAPITTVRRRRRPSPVVGIGDRRRPRR